MIDDTSPEATSREESEAPVPMRVVTWNLNHWQQPTGKRSEAWTHLTSGLKADVGLLQETVPPATLEPQRVVYREIADYRPWGSAVAALGDGLKIKELWSVRTRFARRRFTLANTFPGSVAVAEVEIPGVAPITFVSVYTVVDTYAQTTMLRVVADLVPLFDSAQGSRVVLAGDLNISTATSDPYYLRRGNGILTALESLGLRAAKDVTDDRPAPNLDCPCRAKGACRHIATWKGAELDHFYVSPSLESDVRRVWVDERAVEQGLSDHAPLVLDLALSHEPAARQWDAPTFTEEVRRRHGSDARRVVETLLAWAEDKEVELKRRGIRDVDLTRLPILGDTAPEMWIQIDYRTPSPALMYTVSIRAKQGDIVVQFQWMLQPPFDTPARRQPLLDALNAIPGVNIGSERLNGRPSFPIKAVEDPEHLSKLLALLDVIVDNTRPAGGPVEEPPSIPA